MNVRGHLPSFPTADGACHGAEMVVVGASSFPIDGGVAVPQVAPAYMVR